MGVYYLDLNTLKVRFKSKQKKIKNKSNKNQIKSQNIIKNNPNYQKIIK